MRMTDHPDGEAAVRSARRRAALRARAATSPTCAATRWSVEGDLSALALEERGRPAGLAPLPRRAGARVGGAALPHGRRGAASAKPGYEFLDWGRAHHVGGGSHGSLHAMDSFGSLLWCGTGPDSRRRARAVDAARHRPARARPLRPAGVTRRRALAAGARLLAARARGAAGPRPGRARPSARPAPLREPRGCDRPPPGWDRTALEAVRAAAARRRCARRAARIPAATRAPTWATGGAGRSRSTRRRRARRSPRWWSTTARGACSSLDRLPGGVADGARATGPVRPARRTRRGSGCRCARSSCCRSCARRWRMLHAGPAVLLAFSVSYAFFSAGNIEASVPARLPAAVTCSARLLWRGAGTARARRCACCCPPARCCWRSSSSSAFRVGAQPRRRERDRRRLRGRGRRRPAARGRAALRRLPARHPARRHVRPGALPRLRAVRAGVAVVGDLGRPAGRARRGGGLRPRCLRRPVAGGPAARRPGARAAARLPVGGLSVHAARVELGRQRRARRRRSCSARCSLLGRARGARRGPRAWPA